MSTDGVLESRASVTAGETEAKREKNERQTDAVSQCFLASQQQNQELNGDLLVPDTDLV